MTDNQPGIPHEEHEDSVERALSETQKLERDERDADLKRQQSADERIVQALTKE